VTDIIKKNEARQVGSRK